MDNLKDIRWKQRFENFDKSYKAPRLDKSNGTYDISPNATSGVSSAAIANVNFATSGIVETLTLMSFPVFSL